MKPAVGFLHGPYGAKVAFATHGQGPTVICPAWWVSHLERDFAYPPFRSFFEALGQKLTVVRYDRPGMGLSDSPATRWSLDDEVALLRSVLEHLGNAPVSMFGVSSGGPPAIALAASEPERVRRLVLYGTYADGSELADPGVRDAMLAMVRAHWGLGSRTLADIFVPDLSGPELEELGRWQRETTDGETAANLLRLTYDMNVRALLGRVRPSVTIVLDLLHVLHYIWLAGMAIRRGNAKQADAWVRRYLYKLLTAGHPLDIIAGLHQAATLARLTPEEREPVEKCVGYLRSNMSYIRYP